MNPFVVVALFVQSTATVPAKPTELPRTLGSLSAIEATAVPARADGVLSSFEFREGDRINEGQEIGRIDPRRQEIAVALAEEALKIARLRADDLSGIEMAKISLQHSENELERLKLLYSDTTRTISLTEFEKGEATYRLAIEELKAANTEHLEHQLDVSLREKELEEARRELADHAIVSPHPGIVHEVFRQRGEWIERGNPLVEIVRVDRLKVETFVDSHDLLPHEVVGAEIWIEVDLGSEHPEEFFAGVVERVSGTIEADGRYMIWGEIENRLEESNNAPSNWVLRPGMLVGVSIRFPLEGVVEVDQLQLSNDRLEEMEGITWMRDPSISPPPASFEFDGVETTPELLTSP